MTRELLDLIDAKQQAHEDGNKKLYNKFKKKLSKGIKKSRAKYTHKIQEHLADDPANAWNDIKKLTVVKQLKRLNQGKVPALMDSSLRS